jgi:sigma54-dependent transcription regulator
MSDSFYTAEQLAQLEEGCYSVNPTYERFLSEYSSLALANDAVYEFLRHGFARRLGALKRCIENVYSVNFPERCDINRLLGPEGAGEVS